MTESEIRVYNNLIAQNKLEEKTHLPAETIRKMIKKAVTAQNYALVLADVADYFIMDCNENLSKFDKCFVQKHKQNFNEMRKHLIAAKKCSNKICESICQNACANDACADSDWWLAFIKLVDNRITKNPENTQRLLVFLLSMPEGDSPYKVKLDDFKRLKV